MSDATAPAAAPAVLDPVSIVRSRAYLSALVLAALLGVPISAVAYGFLALVRALQGFLFERLPADLFDGAAPAWWPVPWLALCGLLVALTIRHLPGHGRPLAGPRLLRRWWAAGRQVPPRRGAGLPRHAQPRRRAWPGGAADRHRVRAGRAHGSAGQEGRHADGPDRHGLGGQLRGGQHPAGLPPAGRVPHHGGGGYRRGDAQPRGPSRPARLRHRRPCLPRLGHLDGPGHLLAGPDQRAPRRRPHPGDAAVGRPCRPARCPARLGGALGRPVTSTTRPPPPGAGDRGARPAHRPHRDGLPADHRSGFH